MKPIPEADTLRLFADAVAAAGLHPQFKSGDGFVGDGELRRFHIEGDSRNSLNGWYVLFLDGIPAGEFGCWKRGITITWCAHSQTELTPEERQQLQARIDRARAEREKKEKQRHGAAARMANTIWNAAAPATSHPYLDRKGVLAHGLRVGEWPIFKEGVQAFAISNALLVPVIDIRGRLMSLQAIFEKRRDDIGRDKDFLRDGKKRGGFFMIGTPGPNVALCEGYATGASIHAATGWCVVVCFDAGNLPAVAEALREAMPQAQFVIAADNDRWTTEPVENPGVAKARQAVAACMGRIAVPEFADLDGRPTDFNDLHQREGIDAVRAQLSIRDQPASAVAVPPPERRVVEPIATGTIDTFTPFPDIDGKGKPLDTIANLDELLRRLGVVCRYNVITKGLEILIPGAAYSVDNNLNACFSVVKSWAKRARMKADSLGEYLLTIADANLYNPVAVWIQSRAWDGVDRLPALFNTITPAPGAPLVAGKLLRDVLMGRWLTAAVAACFEPNGIAHKGVLTFTGTQNRGKTSWFKLLAPGDMGVIKDGALLNPSDRDSVFQSISKWLVELGEVDATFRRADLAQLKAFISLDRDTLRRPYARSDSEFARRTVFFASVNEKKFLHDETGNARWWTVACAGIDYRHKIDMQQVWAQVKAQHYDGWRQRDDLAPWHLRPEENTALNTSNEDHQAINPVHEMVARTFMWDAPRENWKVAMTATDVALVSGIVRPTKADVNAVSSYVRTEHTVDEKRHGKNGARMLMMPPKIASGSYGRDEHIPGF